jgi:cell fate regulator YaaT (PSP1 superfamily)
MTHCARDYPATLTQLNSRPRKNLRLASEDEVANMKSRRKAVLEDQAVEVCANVCASLAITGVEVTDAEYQWDMTLLNVFISRKSSVDYGRLSSALREVFDVHVALHDIDK